MAALSPRSINIQVKQKSRPKEMVDDATQKAEAARKVQKEKEYAPPPPEWVIQPPISNGALAEKFKTGRLLGKGGFAICYEGELRNRRAGPNNKTVFALKVVRSRMSQKKMEDKFRTELQIHAKMRHPNIVEFYRAFTYKESTYVVLELCSNGSVMEMVKKRKCLSLPEVRRFTVQICGAMKYMHARNVIHRDLKMGNLFLDSEMNIKIGDFGLAAVLVSQDEVQGLFEAAKHRRTTLCGTPNYIAPEILEKGKGGHDHKVDIWAIGVIVYAMIAGQPPFQSSSQSEIYRRAKNVEYAWPDETKCANDIPAEAKDLVSRLLRVESEERPGPDEVIGHAFFSMHGGNSLPAIMDNSLRYEAPQFLNSTARPRGDVMWDNSSRLSLKSLAKHCGVGLLRGDREPQPAVGADTSLSLYMECVAEEQAGASPIVPLPHDFVYASKFPSTIWPSLQESVSEEPVPTKKEPVIIDITKEQPQITGNSLQTLARPRRGPVQSHAASLRAASVGMNVDRPTKQVGKDLPFDRIDTRPIDLAAAVNTRQGLITDLPVRPSNNTRGQLSSVSTGKADTARATRSRRAVVLEDNPVRLTKEKETIPKRSVQASRNRGVSPEHIRKASEVEVASRARIASNVRNEMEKAPPKQRKVSQTEASQKTVAPENSASSTFIGPNEVVEYITDSRPEAVLKALQKLHRELRGCLENATKGGERSDKSFDIEARSRSFKSRPVVVKWVDYTNKFGIGYILANGSVGCVFKSEETMPPTCVVVSEAESHFKKRNSAAYVDKHQIVPAKGSPIEFIENDTKDGLKRVFAASSQYQVRVNSQGVPDRLGPGFDVYDFEKRKKLCLWDKFGRYMTQSLGKNNDDDASVAKDLAEQNSRTARTRRTTNHLAGPFVKFYQRLGNVGIWGFGDGSFQFNFPDHTKLVISADGTWLDFYHLPASAGQLLRKGSQLGPGALAERSVLCYPTDVLLSGSHRGHEFGDLVEENELHQKIEFVVNVVDIWTGAGGLGRTGTNKWLKWEGMSEKAGKLVWVTVGANGRDGRYEMPKSLA